MLTTAEISYHGPVVAFDLDDTLFQEYTHAVSAYRELAALPCFATDGLPAEIVRVMSAALLKHVNPFDALEQLLRTRQCLTGPDIPSLVTIYRNHTPGSLQLREGSQQCLETLNAHGIRMAIITDGRSHTQRAKIKALGIEKYFHPADILISEETGTDKSSIGNFAAIVHHYPEASQFVYVGDNPAKDFAVPAMLGWETYCLLALPDNIHPQPATGAATATIGSLTELADIVLKRQN